MFGKSVLRRVHAQTTDREEHHEVTAENKTKKTEKRQRENSFLAQLSFKGQGVTLL